MYAEKWIGVDYAYETMSLSAFIERLYDYSIGKAEPRRIAHVAAEHLVAQRAEIERLTAEIERLTEERDYLRHELNNETDRYMAMKETNSVHIAEIERLRALITEWAEADNGVTAAADARPFVREPYDVAIERCDRAYDELRKEAGR